MLKEVLQKYRALWAFNNKLKAAMSSKHPNKELKLFMNIKLLQLVKYNLPQFNKIQ